MLKSFQIALNIIQIILNILLIKYLIQYINIKNNS